jgi:hypothetical protein
MEPPEEPPVSKKMFFQAFPLLAGIAGVVITPPAVHARQVHGVVPPDFPAGVGAPVLIPLELAGDADRAVRLAVQIGEQGETRRLTGQIEPADKMAGTPARVWLLWTGRDSDLGQPVSIRVLDGDAAGPGQLQSGASAGVSGETPDAYQTLEDDPRLKISTPDGAPILSYWHGEPPADWRLPLTSFVDRLIGLDGERLIDVSPGDHLHHRGVFWAWVRVECQGKPIGDWWIPTNIHLEPGALHHQDGPVFSRFVARHDWIHQPKGTSEGKPFITEQVICRTFRTTSAGRAIDIDLALLALEDGVRLGGQTYNDKGYSGLCVRFAEATGVEIESDQFDIRKDTNGLKATWVDWTGIFAGPDGKPLDHRSGGAVFVDRSHPTYPAEWITRFYGPIGVSYPGLPMVEVSRTEPLRLRYRIWIHRGDATEGLVAEQFRAYNADWKWEASKP